MKEIAYGIRYIKQNFRMSLQPEIRPSKWPYFLIQRLAGLDIEASLLWFMNLETWLFASTSIALSVAFCTIISVVCSDELWTIFAISFDKVLNT